MKWINKIVVPRIASQWEDVAFELLISGRKVEMFKLDSKDTKLCCKKMLMAWIDTDIGEKPKTWNKLVTAINEVEELKSATEEIKEQLAINCDEIWCNLSSNSQ